MEISKQRKNTRTFLLTLVARIEKKIEGVSLVNAIAFLAMKAGVPLNYHFEILADGNVVSDDLISDLMNLVDRGLIAEEFKDSYGVSVPIYSARMSQEEALGILKDTLSSSDRRKFEEFIETIRRKTLSEDVLDRLVSKKGGIGDAK
ncbi:MAG: hypothetical protein ACXAB0_10380 [Candidatus Thorarchaeota archaeon]|jgi:hypothetical protein